MRKLDNFLINSLGLTKLPEYLPTIITSFLGFLFVHLILAPAFSQRFFPATYAKLSKSGRHTWAIRVVSQVHTLIIVPSALWMLRNENPEIKQNRLFGWDDNAAVVHSISLGYFIWDTLDATVNFTDLGFVLHGLSCSMVYTLTFKPSVSYYATRYLLWEASTFFLNIHWYFDKTGRTGSTAQLLNGLALLFTFFSVRLVYGSIVSFNFVNLVLRNIDSISRLNVIIFLSGNIALNCLNIFWFTKMIQALRKRFTKSPGQKTPSRENGIKT